MGGKTNKPLKQRSYPEPAGNPAKSWSELGHTTIYQTIRRISESGQSRLTGATAQAAHRHMLKCLKRRKRSIRKPRAQRRQRA